MKTIAIALILFLLAFIGLRLLHPEGILLYQGVVLGAAVALLQWWIARRRPSAMKDGLLSFLLIYAFVFTIPTTVDRAYSVKMIGHIAAAPHGLTRDEIAQRYVRDFVERGGVDKRLQEQRASGTLQEHDGRFELTRLGRALAWSFALTRKLFSCGDPTP